MYHSSCILLPNYFIIVILLIFTHCIFNMKNWNGVWCGGKMSSEWTEEKEANRVITFPVLATLKKPWQDQSREGGKWGTYLFASVVSLAISFRVSFEVKVEGAILLILTMMRGMLDGQRVASRAATHGVCTVGGGGSSNTYGSSMAAYWVPAISFLPFSFSFLPPSLMISEVSWGSSVQVKAWQCQSNILLQTTASTLPCTWNYSLQIHKATIGERGREIESV